MSMLWDLIFMHLHILVCWSISDYMIRQAEVRPASRVERQSKERLGYFLLLRKEKIPDVTKTKAPRPLIWAEVDQNVMIA